MKIRTKLQILAALPVIISFTAMTLMFVLSVKIDRIHKKVDTSLTAMRMVSDIISLTHDYDITKGDRARIQWTTQYNALEAQIKDIYSFDDTPGNKALLDEVVRNCSDAKKHFSELVELDAKNKSGKAEDIYYGVRNNMTNNIIFQLQEILPDVEKIYTANKEAEKIMDKRKNIVIAVLFFVIICIKPPLLLAIIKTITGPIRDLTKGMDIIASGNLEHRVSIHSMDEIGALALGLNEMTQRIREITVSRDVLTREIEERIRMEDSLKANEAKLKETQRIAQLGNWELDHTTNALFWSDEIFQIFEIDKQVFGATYEAFLNAIHPEDREAVNKAYTDSLKNRTDYEIDHRLLMKDGRTKHVHEHCTTYFGPDGKAIRSAGTVQDITELKNTEYAISRLNRELEQRVQERTTDFEKKSSELLGSQTALMNIVEDLNSKTEQLEEANAAMDKVNRELEAFSYSVSHDLRAPLRAIDGFSLALLEDYSGKLDKEADNYLNRIRAASQRMGQLIDDILKLSRLGRTEMSLQNVDLSSLAESVAEELKREHPGDRVNIIVQKGIFAHCDARLLRIALTNLLGNAWKFSSKNPEPRIEFGRVEKDTKKAFFVRDNGVGFDMTYADKLFSPFHRLHSSEEFPGTGIGLATVQRIINRHNGSIWAESETGKGATFYFII